MSEKCTVFYNPNNLLHKCSKPHPESPDRLTTLIASFEKLSKELQGKMQIKEIQKEDIEVGPEETEKLLIELHGEGYWEFVKEMWYEGIKKPEMFINIDTYFMKDTYYSALEAARTTLIAANSLINGGPNSFAVVRPPGHHSGMKSQPHGFSFFNNIALATNYITNKGKDQRIVILDWDVHHGEGTQKLFYHRNDVLYISLHRFDQGKFFPHVRESSSKNIGEDKGEGYNINICWDLEQKPKGSIYSREETCGDEEYVFAFEKIILPVINQFNPNFIFISCGFDSAEGDPIGNLLLTRVGYTYMLEELMKFGCPILLVLEGGYSNDVLGWAGESIARTLTKTVPKEVYEQVKEIKKGKANEIGRVGVKCCIEHIEKYWKV